MNGINELISLLSKAERRSFVGYLSARNKRHDTRNIDLFKALIDEREEVIKTEIGSNAYNVLKKRLYDRLVDFISTRSLQTEVSTEIEIIKRLLLARKLFAYSKYKLAFKTLHKLEAEAIEINHFTLLNEIYHTLIEHSHYELSQEQSILFEKLAVNNTRFLEQEKLNMVYALVRRAYNEAEQDGSSVELALILESNYNKYNISDKQGYNFQSLYQLALIADISGAHKRNYHEIELFFVDKVKQLQGGPEDTEKMLIYHINLLYSVANIFFRKKEFNLSMAYLDDMSTQMERFDKKYYQNSYIKLTTLRALNLNYTGNHQLAAQELDSLFNISKNSVDELLNAKLARVIIHFQQNELELANKILVKFQRSDNWYERNVGFDWLLNKSFIEILLHIELNSVDFVESRINSFVRKYRTYFKKAEHIQAMEFLKLAQKFYNDEFVVNSDDFKKSIKDSLLFRGVEQEDIFTMSYYAWLKAKIEGQNIYDTTMEMIHL
tara:strand:- start:413 stop:1894 length:1482 start_codon:yes stop_codon:yes gene_type:complete